MAKLMALEFTPIKVELFIKAIGSITSKMVRESNAGLMEVATKDSSKAVKNMVKGSIYGQTRAITQVLGSKTSFQALENIGGTMEGCILVHGFRIRCMEREFIPGKMGESMREATTMIKNTDMVNTIGLMVVCLKGSGFMVDVREKAN